MKHVWEGPVPAGHGWSGHLGSARVVLHENGWLQVQVLDDMAEDAARERRTQVLEAAIRRLLARAAHADTVAKAASMALAAPAEQTRRYGHPEIDLLRRLIRAVIDGPSPIKLSDAALAAMDRAPGVEWLTPEQRAESDAALERHRSKVAGVDHASGPDTTAVLVGLTDAAYEDAVRKIGLLAYGDREKLTANQIRSMADELADLLRGLALSKTERG